MDIGSLVTIVGQIATWLTIVLVFFTLLEMRNQRKAAQKPDLIIPKSLIYGYSYGFSNERMTSLLIPRYWRNKEVEAKDEVWIYAKELMTVYNVGFGVAKNIELKWIGKYDQTLQQIKDYCYQHTIPIIIRMDDKKFTVDEQSITGDLEFYLSPEQFKHDFLMPVSVTSTGLMIAVPLTFVELASISIFLNTHYSRQQPRHTSEFGIDFPPLTLELHYDDLENTRYSKKFEVLFSIEMFRVFMDAKQAFGKNLFQATFEFKKLSGRSQN
jgi:hypothetical protein